VSATASGAGLAAPKPAPELTDKDLTVRKPMPFLRKPMPLEGIL
jgi:hypothetical protein